MKVVVSALVEMINLTFDPRLLVLKGDPDISDESLYSRPETEFRGFSQDTVFFPESVHIFLSDRYQTRYFHISTFRSDCYYLLQIYCPNCLLQQW